MLLRLLKKLAILIPLCVIVYFGVDWILYKIFEPIAYEGTAEMGCKIMAITIVMFVIICSIARGLPENQKMLGAQAIIAKSIIEQQHPTNVLTDQQIKDIIEHKN